MRKRWYFCGWLVFCLVFQASTVVFAARLENIHIIRDPKQPRMTLMFDDGVHYSSYILNEPLRLVLKFAASQTQLQIDKINLDNTVISQLRSKRQGDDLLVILELAQAITPLKPSVGKAKLLSVDLTPLSKPAAPATALTPDAKKTLDEDQPESHGLSKVAFDKVVMLAKHDDNSVAQNRLGTFYYQGVHVEQNYRLAAKWFTRAAKHGLAEAQHNLGIMYSKGLGVKQDYRKAAAWLYRASKQGQEKAMYNLAVMYLQGLGVDKSPRKAATLLRKAAKKDHAQAQYLLGVLYSQGTGVKRSYLRGHAWLEVAEKRGIKEAARVKQAIEPKMSAQEIAKSKSLAKRYIESYHDHIHRKGEKDPDA